MKLNLEAETATVLPDRDTLARVSVAFLFANVIAPSHATVIITHSAFSSGTAIAGASVSITQVSNQ